MKVLISGKGGSGKTVISALLSKALAKRGYSVLVIDGDESNLNLHRFLGLSSPKEFKEYLGGRKKIFDKLKDINITRINEIPNEFISEKDNIKLMCIGKIHEFEEGCACPMGALLREFLINLNLNDNEFVIIDTEAGIEHFGRGVENGCDLILFILDPTMDSVLLSKRVEKMKINRPVYFIINKVLDEESKSIVLSKVSKEKVLAIIPFMDSIFKATLMGEELSLDVPEINKIADNLIEFKKTCV